MLTENDVVDAVGSYLQAQGFEIEQDLTTTQHGIDIIAIKAGGSLHIEAKGATSSKRETARFGKPFSRGQVLSHISRALFESSRVVSSDYGAVEAAIALPDDQLHRERIDQISNALRKLGISVFWVNDVRDVEWWR